MTDIQKAITIKQPWAFCITHLDKSVENREMMEYSAERIKAFVVWGVGENPADGCFLVMANSVNQAKQFGFREMAVDDLEYIDVRARRVPELDDVAAEGGPRVIYSNAGLPADRPFYSENEEYLRAGLRAFRVWWSGCHNPLDHVILVFADNEVHAKTIAGPQLQKRMGAEYLNAIHAPCYDDLAAEDGPRVISSNSGLPADRPFYSDNEV